MKRPTRLTSKETISAIISEVMAGKRNMPALPERIRQRDEVLASRNQVIIVSTPSQRYDLAYDYYSKKGSGGFTGD